MLYFFFFFATILYHFSEERPQDSGSPAGLPESNLKDNSTMNKTWAQIVS